MRAYRSATLAAIVVTVLCVQAVLVAAPDATSLQHPDAYTIIGPKHYLAGYPAINPSGTVNFVVEIPSGSNQKWEVDKRDGYLRWEFKKGKPRVVKYLPYPGNYGMVPRTILSKEHGGDGDPLDVIVLGPALARGAVVEVRLVGLLRMLDRGEQDDKLLAVAKEGPLSDVKNLADLYKSFPGVTTILETWFGNYKGPGKIKTLGFGDAPEAKAVLAAASKAFEKLNTPHQP